MWAPIEMKHVMAAIAGMPRFCSPLRAHAGPVPSMDVVMVFGFVCGFMTLVCWGYRRESSALGLAFIAGLAGMAVYGLLVGAWPLAVVQGVWFVAALRQWNSIQKYDQQGLRLYRRPPPAGVFSEGRITRLFGSISLN